MSAHQKSIQLLNKWESLRPQRVKEEQWGGASKSRVARESPQLGCDKPGLGHQPRNPGAEGSSMSEGVAAVLAKRSRPRGAEAGEELALSGRRSEPPRGRTKSGRRSGPTVEAKTTSRTRATVTGVLSTTPARVDTRLTDALRASAMNHDRPHATGRLLFWWFISKDDLADLMRRPSQVVTLEAGQRVHDTSIVIFHVH